MANPTRYRAARCVVAAIVLAAGNASASGSDDAAALFVRGRKLVEQGEYQAALADLRASYGHMASPNTLLLIAHAERGIRHRVEAALLYEQVVREAGEKIKAGESRYQAALDDARRRLEELAGELARIELRVKHAPADARVTIALTPAQGSREADGTLVLARMWIEPGRIPVRVESSKGPVDASLSLVAGVMEIVNLDYETHGVVGPTQAAPIAPASPSVARAHAAPSERGSSRIPAMTWVAGGIGLAGVATFAIAGTLSNNTWSELEACSPQCPPSERAAADRGRTEQTIANVGLVVGGVGLVAAAGFLLFRPKKQPAAVSLHVGAGSAALRGTW